MALSVPGCPVGWPALQWEWADSPELPMQTVLWQDSWRYSGLPSVGTTTGQYMRGSEHTWMQSLGSRAGGTLAGH